jgi:hypothetical protein
MKARRARCPMTSAAPSPSGHRNRGRKHHPSNRGGCAELALLAVPPRPRTPFKNADATDTRCRLRHNGGITMASCTVLERNGCTRRSILGTNEARTFITSLLLLIRVPAYAPSCYSRLSTFHTTKDLCGDRSSCHSTTFLRASWKRASLILKPQTVATSGQPPGYRTRFFAKAQLLYTG